MKTKYKKDTGTYVGAYTIDQFDTALKFQKCSANLKTDALALAFKTVFYLVCAARNPSGFTEFTRIQKELPGDDAVMLTVDQIEWLFKNTLSMEVTKEDIKQVLDAAMKHSQGMVEGRSIKGATYSYKIDLSCFERLKT